MLMVSMLEILWRKGRDLDRKYLELGHWARIKNSPQGIQNISLMALGSARKAAVGREEGDRGSWWIDKAEPSV